MRCLKAEEIQRGFNNVELLCSLFGQFINLVVSYDVCVDFDFADGDIIVVEAF